MTRTRRIAALLASPALLQAACARHVSLEAPRPDAPFEERRASYERLRPAGTHHQVVVTATANTVSATTHTSLILGNGSTVHHAEDLLPVVASDSPTAEAARTFEQQRSRANVGFTISTIGAVVAFGSMIVPLANDDIGDGESPSIFWPGVVVGGLAFFIAGGVAFYSVGQANDAKAAAFATYDSSLRANLRLCVDGTRLVECGAAEAPPPVVETAPPPAAAPRAMCDTAGRFQIDLAYDGGCSGPTRLAIAHDPKVSRRIDLAPGSFDPKAESLDTVAFAPQGCHAELVHRGPAGELRFSWDGVGGDRVEGRGALGAPGGTSCPVRISGTWAAQ